MKKVYQKPDIVFESFTLSTNIAGDCEYKTLAATEVCGYEVRGDVVFMDGVSSECTTYPQTRDGTGDGIYIMGHDSICYHIPAEYNNLFNS